MKAIAKSILRPAWRPIRRKIQQLVDTALASRLSPGGTLDAAPEALAALVHRQGQEIDALRSELKALRSSTFSPDPSWSQAPQESPFFAYSNCQAADFYHPRFIALCKLIGERPRFHRKQWEWVFVLHKLLESGVIKAGARGLVFGVGREPLPATFASLNAFVTATDAPLDMPTATSWTTTNQHSASLDALAYPEIVPTDKLRQHVVHDYCDMNAIDPKFRGFDFNWSSCCFEHLGSLEVGVQFVINAVEKTLRPGGVAVHTTEFNVSSNEQTLEVGETVIYRKHAANTS
ncbi:hypothetical protein ACIPRI_16065 [Variovorax sp. LARHSF232]